MKTSPPTCSRCGAQLPPGASPAECPGCLREIDRGSTATRLGTSTDSQEPAASIPDRPRFFSDYEIIREIARGGMGIVFQARQLSLNRTVAIKMILSGQRATAMDMRRFKTEAQAVASLQHPGIVAIHEVGEVDGQPFFSMEFVEGRNLAEHLRDAKPSPADAARLAQSLAEAVQYAHQRGILHRDLKPSNVLIGEDGRARITDFGLAKRLDENAPDHQTHGVIGTPSYLAPELAAGGQFGSVASDVYGLGAILYELLTGLPPFRGETPVDTLRKISEDEPRAPRSLNENLDLDLEVICLKCLEKDPRPQNNWGIERKRLASSNP